ncbi:MAG: hypothetical protein ACLR6T_00175 [Intestinibacter sp.]
MKKKTKIFKIVLLCVVVAIMIGITIYLIPLIQNLSTRRTTSFSRRR